MNGNIFQSEAAKKVWRDHLKHLERIASHPGSNGTRDYTYVSKEQRRMEQMDKLRRTLVKSERKRRERALYR